MTPTSADAKRAQIARIIRDYGSPLYDGPEHAADAILDVLAEPNKGMRLASKRYKAATKVPTGPGVWRAMIEAIRSGA